jgi:hypothetical protein
LFPRLARLAGIVEPNATLRVDFLDDPDAGTLSALTFFRAAAALNLPERATGFGITYFVAAVFRPDFKSILVRINEIDMATVAASDDNVRWEAIRTLAEQTVREFTYQWSCPRALWRQPAEETLLEFQTRGNGTIPCGR